MSLIVDALKKLNTEKQMASDANGLPPITNYIDENIDDESFSFDKKKVIIISLIVGIIISVIVFIMFFLPMIKYSSNQTYKATIVNTPVAKQQDTKSSNQGNAPIITDKPSSNTNIQQNSNLSSNNVKQVSNSNSNSNANSVSPVSDFFPTENNNKQLNQPIENKKENNNEVIQKTESKSVYIDPIQALLPPTTIKKEEEPVIRINDKQGVNNDFFNTQTNNQNTQSQSVKSQFNGMPTQNSYEDYVKNAVSSFNKKDYKMSLNNYLQAYSIKKEPSIAENITTLYVLINEPTKAIKFIKENNIKNPQFVGNLIMNLVDKSYRYEANQLINFSRSFKDNGDLAFAEGYYHVKNQNFQKAEIAFNRARNLNPSSPVYSYTYATVIESDGKHKEALEIYRNVLHLNPDEELAQRTNARINALEKLYK